MSAAYPPPTAAQCGAHPSEAAVATCHRCGSFVCAGCARRDVSRGVLVCPPCAARLHSAGLSGQTYTLGVLMIVNGALLLVMTLLGVLGLIFLGAAAVPGGIGGVESNQEGMVLGILAGVYGVIALVHGAAGGLQIYGGIQAMKQRRRTWIIVALSAGMLTLFNLYCALTSLALFIYGLVVMLDAGTKASFAAAAEAEAEAEQSRLGGA